MKSLVMPVEDMHAEFWLKGSPRNFFLGEEDIESEITFSKKNVVWIHAMTITPWS